MLEDISVRMTEKPESYGRVYVSGVRRGAASGGGCQDNGLQRQHQQEQPLIPGEIFDHYGRVGSLRHCLEEAIKSFAVCLTE